VLPLTGTVIELRHGLTRIYTVLTGHKKAQKKFFSVNSVANKYEASVAILK
jgi:hypothetical protein